MGALGVGTIDGDELPALGGGWFGVADRGKCAHGRRGGDETRQDQAREGELCRVMPSAASCHKCRVSRPIGFFNETDRDRQDTVAGWMLRGSRVLGITALFTRETTDDS